MASHVAPHHGVVSVDQLKTEGNAAFAKGNHEQAIKLFSAALELDEKNHVLFSNRAAAYTALGKTDAGKLDLAIADAKKCIDLDAKFAKGYSRLATALIAKKDYAAAVQAFASGLIHCPTDKLLTEGLANAQKLMSAQSGSKQQTEQKEEPKEYVIGIDLGTTFCAVGVWINEEVKMLPNDRGSLTTPSYVSFNETGKRFIGQAAKNQASQFPKTTLYDIKRIIGQKFEDKGVEEDCSHFPFKVVASEQIGNKSSSSDDSKQSKEKARGKPLIEIDIPSQGKKHFAPEEISAFILSYLKKCAETYLKAPVKKAVITVPAYFNDSQRQATKTAGKLAGLEVLRILNEPTAAALAYNLDKKEVSGREMNILVFDLGGGTFDVSVLAMSQGAAEVKATGGDTRLGGEDIDITTTMFLLKEAQQQGFPDILALKDGKDSKERNEAEKAYLRLKQAAEQVKKQLSSSSEAEIIIEGLYTTQEKKKLNFSYTLTRDVFERINQVWFIKCLDTVKHVLKDAKLDKSKIDEVVLVGGSTRIPKIQAMLKEFFGGKELCLSLNPDEAVAYGATVQAAILTGQRGTQEHALVLLDVTPLSLGIETVGKMMSVVIPRNTRVPCIKTQIYTTEENYQEAVDVLVFEGERAKTDENNLLGQFTISGIERAKRGEPKIEVTFAVDSNGILEVSAKDLKTKAKASVSISSRHRTTDAEVEQMLKSAEQYKKEDEEWAQKQETVHELELLLNEVLTFSSEHANDDNISKTQAENLQKLEELAAQTQMWLDEEGEQAKLVTLKQKYKEVEGALNKVSRRK